MASDLRQSRLWQDSLAHATVFEGVPGDCMKWLQFAKLKLQFMLHNSPGPLSATYQPADSVTIRVDSRPNRIWIKAGSKGDVYVTIQNLAVGTITHTALPPYQAVTNRFIYATENEVLEYPLTPGGTEFYAGGTIYSDNGDATTTEHIVVHGDSWRSQTTAMSWTTRFEFVSGSYYLRVTLFIGGRYGELPAFGTVPPIPAAGAIVAAAMIQPTADIIALYPGAASYPKTAIFLLNTGSGLAIRMYGIGTAFTVGLSGSFLGQHSVTLPTTGYSGALMVSGFARDAQRIAVITPVDGSTHHQKAYIMTFSANYTTVTANEVYDEAVQRREVTSSNTTVVDGFGNGTMDTSLVTVDVPGEPVIQGVRTDGDDFCVLMTFITDPNHTETSHLDNTYNGNRYGTSSMSKSYDIHVQIAAVTASGVAKGVTQKVATLLHTENIAANIGSPNPGEFTIYDVFDRDITIWAGYFSAITQSMLLKIREIETTHTSSGVGRDVDVSQLRRYSAASVTTTRKADIAEAFETPLPTTVTVPNNFAPFPASSSITYEELYDGSGVYTYRVTSQNNDRVVLWNLTLGEVPSRPGINIHTNLPISENISGPSTVSYTSGRADEYTSGGVTYYSPIALTQLTFSL